MNEHCIKATIREHGLVKLVMSKLRLDQNYQMNIESLLPWMLLSWKNIGKSCTTQQNRKHLTLS